MVKKLEDYQKTGEEIFHKIHLATYPVAFKYIKNIETEIPAAVKRPIDSGMKLSICQAITLARRSGEQLCITAEDNFCTPASAGHGWVPITKEEFVESQVRQGWSKDEEAEKRRAEQVYAKNFERVIAFGYRGVIIAPLNETPVIPDAILIYGDGKQLTYLIHALTFEHKKSMPYVLILRGLVNLVSREGLCRFSQDKSRLSFLVQGIGPLQASKTLKLELECLHHIYSTS